MFRKNSGFGNFPVYDYKVWEFVFDDIYISFEKIVYSKSVKWQLEEQPLTATIIIKKGAESAYEALFYIIK